jgi:hypothetical protein
MEYNPYKREFNELKSTISELNDCKENLLNKLKWYHETDIDELKKDLKSYSSDSEKQIEKISKIKKDIISLKRSVKNKKAKIKSRYNPVNWFSKEQNKFRKEYNRLNERVEKSENLKQKRLSQNEELNEKIDDLKTTINDYHSFNREKTLNKCDELKDKIFHLEEKLAPIRDKMFDVDQMLEPIVTEINALVSKKEDAEYILSKANNFDFQLSLAPNSYERAMIHKKCENVFGEGSPKKIINKQKRIIKKLERDISKTEKRAKKIGKKAARIIKTVIIDGNNMCYEDGEFVGLSPLIEVTTELSKQFGVIVVFDSNIRSILNTNDARIRSQFVDDIKVHVVASRQLADETILELASGNHSTYIISNDRFADYNEKEVVKSERVIRHEIINNQVFIHDFKLSVIYN